MNDVIIIGAGPIGIACGIEAEKRGLNYAIFDKGTLVNSLFNYPLNMTFFSTSDKLEIGKLTTIKVKVLKYNFPKIRNLPSTVNCADDSGKINIIFFIIKIIFIITIFYNLNL